MEQTSPMPPHEEAFRHVVAHRTMLKAYVQAIVRDPDLAEDAFSEVAIEIARSWARYDRTRPFAFWARGLARRVAFSVLRKHGALPALLDEEALDAVGARLDELGEEARLDERKRSLRACLENLSETNRRMIELRYFENRTYEEIASALSRNVNALYAAFSRIHEALHKCMQKRMESA